MFTRWQDKNQNLYARLRITYTRGVTLSLMRSVFVSRDGWLIKNYFRIIRILLVLCKTFLGVSTIHIFYPCPHPRPRHLHPTHLRPRHLISLGLQTTLSFSTTLRCSWTNNQSSKAHIDTGRSSTYRPCCAISRNSIILNLFNFASEWTSFLNLVYRA